MLAQMLGRLKEQLYDLEPVHAVCRFAQGMQVCMLDRHNPLHKLGMDIPACKMVLDTVAYCGCLAAGKKRNLLVYKRVAALKLLSQ